MPDTISSNLTDLPVGSIIKDEDGDRLKVVPYDENSDHGIYWDADEGLIFCEWIDYLPGSHTALEPEEVAEVVSVPEESDADADAVAANAAFLTDIADDFNTAAFQLAVKFERVVTFRYAKGEAGRNIETRKVLPSNVSDDGLVVGHDPDRNGVRAYRVDRVVGEVSL